MESELSVQVLRLPVVDSAGLQVAVAGRSGGTS